MQNGAVAKADEESAGASAPFLSVLDNIFYQNPVLQKRSLKKYDFTEKSRLKKYDFTEKVP